MKNLNKFFNLKIKWRFWAIILLLVIGGFSIYNLIKSPEKSPLNAFLNSPFLDSAENPAAKDSLSPAKTGNQGEKADCAIKERMLKVRGNSLAGLIEDGAILKILMGYYKCHLVERGDLVVYNYPGGDPLIKIVKGVPGDKFQLKKSQANCWNILINEKILKNSQNLPYCVNEQNYGMLSLYEKDYKGIIPQDAYLILGNLASGSLDSSRFGLIDKSDILGKVEQ